MELPPQSITRRNSVIERLQAKRNEEGFTLIELLIVIIVLGILAAIVVFAVGNTRSDAVESSCRTNFKSVQLSAEAVQTKLGHPGTLADLSTPASGGLFKNAAAYPTSSDYTLTYAQVLNGAGAPVDYTITIAGTGTSLVGGTDATTGCKKA
jgi:general secretion pathway protein G